MIVHPKYNWKENINGDIALLHKETKIESITLNDNKNYIHNNAILLGARPPIYAASGAFLLSYTDLKQEVPQ